MATAKCAAGCNAPLGQHLDGCEVPSLAEVFRQFEERAQALADRHAAWLERYNAAAMREESGPMPGYLDNHAGA
jgi:hypothetical protein